MEKHDWDRPGIGFVLGILGALGIGLALMQAIQFWLGASISYICSMIILIRYWNGLVATVRNRSGSVPLRELIFVVVAFVLSIVVTTNAIFGRITAPDPDLASNRGVLQPAKENDPPFPAWCHHPPGSILVYYGSNLTWMFGSPFSVLTIHGMDMIAMSKSSDNEQLNISILRVFDDRDNIIVHIQNNAFFVSPDVRLERPDRSSLQVFDHLDSKVLDIKLINKDSIKISGIIRYPGREPVIIDDKAFTIMRGGHAVRLSGSCVAAGMKAAINIE